MILPPMNCGNSFVISLGDQIWQSDTELSKDARQDPNSLNRSPIQILKHDRLSDLHHT